MAVTDGPDAALLLVDRLLAFDHATRTADGRGPRRRGRPWLGRRDGPRAARCRGRRGGVRRRPSGPGGRRLLAPRRRGRTSPLIVACQDAIRAGDAYQLCLTNSAQARTDADPLAVHLRLRRASPAPHAGYLRIAGDVLVSSSPEQFLRVDGRRTRPHHARSRARARAARPSPPTSSCGPSWRRARRSAPRTS